MDDFGIMHDFGKLNYGRPSRAAIVVFDLIVRDVACLGH
jgi:hypothetical protein